ncbi:MAG: hypothetical protein R3F30_15570, partial [Planctomycetota bacterium]
MRTLHRKALPLLVVPLALAVQACGGGGSNASVGGVLTGRLLAERSPGDGPELQALGGPGIATPPPAPGDESLHEAGLADPVLLTEGGVLAGRVGGPRDPLDLWRLGPVTEDRELTVIHEGGPVVEVLAGGASDPTRSSWLIGPGQARVLTLSRGDEVVLVVRGGAEPEGWQVRFADRLRSTPKDLPLLLATTAPGDPVRGSATLREILGLADHVSAPGEVLLHRAPTAAEHEVAASMAGLGYVLLRRTGEDELWRRAGGA